MTLQSEFALRLASSGFAVFPCEVNSKLPAIKDFPNKATTDLKQVEAWWNGVPKNVGVSTSHFGAKDALVVVDVDLKNGKRGDLSLLQLELEGFEMPSTFTVSTPSGGSHIYFRTSKALRQGVDLLGNGLDVRSLGGYVLGPGSSIDGREYVITNKTQIAPAPQWLIDKLGPSRQKPSSTTSFPNIEPDRAASRAQLYLTTAPVAVEGQGGDALTFKVAAHLKDLGCTVDQAIELIIEWNERCLPPWSIEDLTTKVHNAFKYGKEPGGVSAPEAIFPPVEVEADEQPTKTTHPFAKLNQSFAFVFAGGTGNILWETRDRKDDYVFHLMNKQSFFDMHAAKKLQIGDKTKAAAQMWMEWPGRRSFEGLVFEPGREVDAKWFNMWRGFAVQPADSPDHPMVDRWREHIFENLCSRDKSLADWFISWFAHLIQKPYEKPLVAVVLRGGKGVGKNACIERVGKLLGAHSMVTSRRRYLVSN